MLNLTQKKGGENSPISPPLDPRLITLVCLCYLVYYTIEMKLVEKVVIQCPNKPFLSLSQSEKNQRQLSRDFEPVQIGSTSV